MSKDQFSQEDFPDINDALRSFPEMERYDLGDFNDTRLSLGGELEIPHFDDQILVDVGATILSVSRLVMNAESEATMTMEAPRFGYIVSNLATERPHAAVLFDDQLVDSGLRIAGKTFDGVPYDNWKCYSGQSVRIGNKTTPELDLPDVIDDEHFAIRIGAMRGNLHFIDLYSRLGTVVYLPKNTKVNDPLNEWRWFAGRKVTRSATEGEWVERRRS